MTEPVSLPEGKQYLRVEHTEEDDLITTLIAAARSDIEAETGRFLVDTTKVEVFSCWPYTIRLCYFPVKSITSVRYKDTTDTWVTMDSSDLAYDLTSPRATIAPAPMTVWPTVLEQPTAIEVTYVCGPSSSIDPRHKAAILRRLTELYENRNSAEAKPGTNFLLTSSRMRHI